MPESDRQQVGSASMALARTRRRGWSPSMVGNGRTIAETALLAAAYFVSAQVGLAFAVGGGSASPIWPPAGIAVAALVIGGRRLWPGVAMGAFLTGIVDGAPPLLAGLTSLAATGEAVIALELLRHLGSRPQLDRLVDVRTFVLAGCAVPAAFAASVASISLIRAGSIGPMDAVLTWLAWWAGDALSILIVGGLLLTWLSPSPAPAPARGRVAEQLAALAVVSGVSVVLFYDVLDLRSSGQSVAFPIIPVIIWVAFRAGPRGNAVAAMAFSTIAIGATAVGRGPFVGTTAEGTLAYLTLFIAMVAITGSAVAAVVAEREAGRLALEEASRNAGRALRQLQAVEAIGRLLAEQGPTPDALDTMVGVLVEVFGYTHPSVYTGDEALVRLGAQRGYHDPLGEIDASRGVIGRVMRTRQTQFLPDVGVDTAYIAADPTVRSEVAAPLLSRGAFLGVLSVESRTPLGEADLAAVSVVADRVAAALALALERQDLAELAIRDSLTGLHNRRYFDGAIEGLAASRARLGDRERRSLAVIMFDLDRFGDLNNLQGHQVGDEVLRAFGRILAGRLRGSDLVARYGGEEFIAVLSGARADDAERIAEEIRAELEASTILGVDGRPILVTVSAGCAAGDTADATPEALISVADVGLRMAKRAGRNLVVAA